MEGRTTRVVLGLVRRDRLYALWRAAATGMRRGELLGATWPALDLIARRLYLTQALSKGPRDAAPRFGPPKTDRGRRAVPLDPETATTLKQHRHRQPEERFAVGEAHGDLQLVFCRENGRPLEPDSVSQRFARLVRRTGLPHPVARPSAHVRHLEPQRRNPYGGREPDTRT